ncbi:MAG: hypothetical protein L0Y66_01245 [Myxococcaceae bacterium]|nr:hypothetical protein [Myxococcaceae bacterium]MCI0671310.1 hypothetical protein [Myxococcaceae bacterium]
MRSTFALLPALLLSLSPVLSARAEAPKPAASKPSGTQSEACEHGVKKALCTRCNPKLAPVYKAKGDWCAEHERPESQCAICHPELEKQGVKR